LEGEEGTDSDTVANANEEGEARAGEGLKTRMERATTVVAYEHDQIPMSFSAVRMSVQETMRPRVAAVTRDRHAV
jgi:hypothetical protein